jgi:hypothetical protein
MTRLVVGLVFLANYDEADDIITQIRQQFDIELLHVETSYGKLWIIRDKEGNHSA